MLEVPEQPPFESGAMSDEGAKTGKRPVEPALASPFAHRRRDFEHHPFSHRRLGRECNIDVRVAIREGQAVGKFNRARLHRDNIPFERGGAFVCAPGVYGPHGVRPR